MELSEVKIGDMVTFTHNKKKLTGKVIYRHDSADNKKAERAALMGHVNVQVMDNNSYPVTVHVSKLKPAIKEETQMEEHLNETVLDLIDHIDSGDNIAAEATLNNILQQRAAEVLDALKVEVASTMFNTQECADCEEQNEEVKVGDTVSPNYGPNKGKKTKVTRVHPNKSVDTEHGYHSPGAYDHHANEEVTNEALKGNQHKIDANKNGKIDAHDFKLLRGKKKGMKEEVELDEASYSAKKARAGKDIGKPGKMFGKIAKKASRKYGKERGAKIAGAVLAKLRKKGK